MVCGKCGAENEKEAKFCRSCGKPLQVDEEFNKDTSPIQEEDSETKENRTDHTAAVFDTVHQSVEKAKTLPKKYLIGAGCVIAAFLIVISIFFNAGSTIKLDKYMTIEVDGYDGYGKARAVIDWDAIREKYNNKLSFTSSAKKEYGGLLGLMTPVDAIQDSVRIEVSQNSRLSNGDKIDYTWNINENLTKYVKCKVKYKDGNYKVSGLEKVETFDAFANLVVEFTGTAPNGSVNLNYNGTDIKSYDFSCDKSNNLSNGEIVKITIDSNKIENYAQTLGKVPAELEKEYTVEGLKSYLKKIDEIDEKALNEMKQQADDVFKAAAAQNWGEGEDLLSFTYLGEYLLTAKDIGAWGNKNSLYLVYRAQVKNSYTNNDQSYDQENSIYWYISYSDLLTNSKEIVDLNVTKYNTPNNSFKIDSGVNNGWWGTKTWSYRGYATLADLYKDVVTKNIASYVYEDHVNENAS